MDFNEHYAGVHASLRADTSLVERLFTIADQHHNPKREETLFVPACLSHRDIPLGILFGRYHPAFFHIILAHMHLVHDLGRGEIDLSRVYALLIPQEHSFQQKGLGIVMEDFSCGNRYAVIGGTPVREMPAVTRSVLAQLFSRTRGPDFNRIVFEVDRPEYEGGVRHPVADLNHSFVADDTPYYLQYREYAYGYRTDERFRLWRPS